MDFDDFLNTHFLTKDSEIIWRDRLMQAIEVSLGVLRQNPEAKICSDVSLPDLEKIFEQTNFPTAGVDFAEVFKESLDKIVTHSVKVADRRYLGHMTGANPFSNLILDIFISALNQNVVKIETALAGSFVEKQIICWLHNLIFNKSDAYYKNHIHSVTKTLGNATNGGTMGNLTALTVARNLALPESEQEGIAAALAERGLKKLVILASKRVHYSIKKVAAILGIGAQNVIEIPVHPMTNQISLSELTATIKKLEKHKTGILAIVGVAGTTETGSIDDLATLASIARDNGVWFHVDAAWGGPLLTSEKYKHLLSGIEQADSVVIDGHKFFSVTLNQGAVLFRNETSLDAVRHSANYIIRRGSVDLGRTSLEGSRRFDSFKLWFLIKSLGKQGYEKLVNRSLEMASLFSDKIEKHPCFEITSVQQTNIITYRYVPQEWKDKLLKARVHLENAQALQTGEDAEADVDELAPSLRFASDFLNEVNIELQKRQRLLGHTFVSRTTLESVYPGYDIIVLRAVLMNPFTTYETLGEILDEQTQLGNKIASEIWEKRCRIAPVCFIDDFGPVANSVTSLIK